MEKPLQQILLNNTSFHEQIHYVELNVSVVLNVRDCSTGKSQIKLGVPFLNGPHCIYKLLWHNFIYLKYCCFHNFKIYEPFLTIKLLNAQNLIDFLF